MPTGYRVEVSPNSRAVCKNTECKKNGEKILKGELRFGSLFEIKEHTSWAWKHWGCVTPKQIENWNDFTGGDTEFIDGFEELPPEYQEKVSTALQEGHVADEEWKGDIQKNRPGQKGFRVKTPKKQAAQDDWGSEDEQVESPVKGKGKKRSRAVKAEDDEDEHPPPPKKSRRKPKKEAVKEEGVDDEDHDPTPEPKKSRRKAKKVESVDDEPPEAPKKRSRAKKAAEDVGPPAYDGAADEPPKPKGGRKKKAAPPPAEETEKAADIEPARPKRGRKKATA